jgi:hypothetical protein
MSSLSEDLHESRQDATRLRKALAAAEGERIALADEFRAYMVANDIHPTVAALIVQGIIDNAKPKGSA